ncbi:SDR family oxidoreductase [Flavobacterium sp.]|jgi:nucleoside-diphosphate-sugar epimerase|uniref:SDR family oxidoreductase n=1 Tax=Flavobacterium sp. TaxID=239 RepID=UPI002A7F2AC0|nr:SDR family oxidoreductase [Flavobacterium sp.]
MKEKNISILGCGWLGLPLAKKLIENGFSIKGSTTSEEKLVVLEANKIQPYLIALYEDKIIGNIIDFLTKSEVLIIDIPPKLRGSQTENFVSKIKNLIIEIEKSAIKKVLFISSTSVYGDTFPIVELNEESIPNPDSEGGKQLIEVEQLLQSNPNFKTTVVRFGGLIGKDRHPIKFLAGRENVENPEAPINFIHQDDCIGIIEKILLQNYWEETFNAVAPEHPTRAEYYHKKALEMNLKVPTFAKDSISKGKIVSSQKLQKILDYSFQKQI